MVIIMWFGGIRGRQQQVKLGTQTQKNRTFLNAVTKITQNYQKKVLKKVSWFLSQICGHAVLLYWRGNQAKSK